MSSSMAFYTSRVDDDGNEIEKRPSARSLTPSLGGGGNNHPGRMNLSSRSCEAKTSVRYVNPAAYIEKNTEGIDLDKLNLYDSKCYTPLESRSDIVPPLDLQSEDNYPTTRDFTFSYRKHCEATKIVLKPDQAYETWLSAKRKHLSDEAAKRKRAEEQKRKEQEERKRLAEEKFQIWLEKKTRLQKQKQKQQQQQRLMNNGNNSNSTIRMANSEMMASSTSTSPSTSMSEKSLKPQLSESEVQARIAEWEQTKQNELERRRELKRLEEQRRQQLLEQRRQLANEAWNKWIADAAKKPKPVPLNRGFFTLRGTVSDIFVNPNEWQHIIPVEDD